MSFDLHFREGTVDEEVVQQVLIENEYNLPDQFEPDDVILDVGAHVGVFAAACLLRGARHIVCLEPEESNFALLMKNTEGHPGVYRFRRAIGGPARGGKCRLRVTPGGFTATHNTLAGHGKSVNCTTLDELIDEALHIFQANRVRLLKLDCEGAEYEALYHAGRLDFVEEIVGESHCLKQVVSCDDNAGRQRAMNHAALACYLWERGFRVTVLDASPKFPGCNCLFFAERGEPLRHAGLLERHPGRGPGDARRASAAAVADNGGPARQSLPAAGEAAVGAGIPA